MLLSQLQNLCKRDPAAHKEEFLIQLQHFESQLKIFQLKPSSNFKEFQEQISFLAHVASCYRQETSKVASQLSQLLEQNCGIMEPELRKSIAKALILLRNRDMIQPLDLLQLFFKLFKVPDKLLRVLLYQHIVKDIKNINSKHKNNKLNNSLQSFMFTMMQDANEVAAKKALDVMIELYKKKIWNDPKTVNAISLGCFSKNTKVLVATLRFFLGGSDEEEEESDDEKSQAKRSSKSGKDIYREYHKGGKKTRSKIKKLKQEFQKAGKAIKKKNAGQPNFAAIDLINDPQGYAEKLFAKLQPSIERFEVRLMMMNFISRLIGAHKLFVENFYPWILRYLRPKQDHITYILAVTAQACHDLVPPESLAPIIKEIANHFVHDRSADESVSMGLNTIREMCMRCPLAIDADLLQDLAQYKDHRNKGVVMAARSLINFYRTAFPALLQKKDRGKGHDIEAKPLAYGASKVASGIEGIELLEKYKAKKQSNPDASSDDENMSDGEEGEWMDVNEDEEGNEGEEGESGDEEMEEGEDGWESASDDEEVEDGDEWKSVGSGDEVNLDEDEDDEEGNEDEEEDDDDEDGEEEEKLNGKEEEKPKSLKKPKEKPTKQESEEKKLHLDALTILTDEDLEKLRKLKERKREREDDEDDEVTEVVDFSNIEGYRKKQRLTSEEKKAVIEAGREGRRKSRKGVWKENKSGSTNEEKLKNKPFQLMKFSKQVREKKFRSLRDKQRTRTKHSKTMKRMKKYKH